MILSSTTLAQWVLWVWVAGALVVLLRLLRGAVLVRHVLRRATPLDTPDWTRPLVEVADRLGQILAKYRAPLVILEACRTGQLGRVEVFRAVAEAVKIYRRGGLIVVADDAKRENEGDLICAASKITPEKVW